MLTNYRVYMQISFSSSLFQTWTSEGGDYAQE